MAGFDRDEAVWYYLLGGRPLGPVSWREIEELIADAIGADELRVARGGEDGWRSAQDVLDEIEEAAAEETDEEVEPGAEEAPDEAEAEPEEEAPPEPPTPVHGLKAWLSQASEIVFDDAKEYLSASVLLALLGSVTLLVCFPALHVGMYAMALKRFRGEQLEPNDVLAGFRYFARALGLYILLLMIALPVAILLLIAVVMAILAIPDDVEFYVFLPIFSVLIWLAVALTLALPGAVAFFAVPLMIERDLPVGEALKRSWAVTATRPLSFFALSASLALVSTAGWLLCWIGVIFTLPLMPVAQVCAYRHYFREA